MSVLALALLGFAVQSASAQEFDAHGASLPPDGASVRDPVLGFGGAYTGSPVFTLWSQSATQLLVERLAQGPDVTDRPIVGSAFGAELGAQAGLYGPLGVGVSLPLWFTSDGEAAGGPALGDMTLWLPISLYTGAGPRIGVAPMVNLPTGAAGRFLGDPGLGGGGLVSAGYSLGMLFASVDAGLELTPRTGLPEWPGGLHFRSAWDFGVAPTENFAGHIELRQRAPFSSEAPTLPSEALLTAKVRPQDRLWLTFSGGRAITRGVGAPGLRMLLGVSGAPGTKPVEAEIVMAPEPKEVHVIDEQAFPITGATVVAGRAESVTDFEGYADLPPRSVRDGAIVVTHPHFETETLTVNPDDPWWEVRMVRKPVPVAVSVVGPQGALLLVDVAIDGPYDPGPPLIDEAGVHHWDLREGTWMVRMASPGLGSQERTIVIEHTRADPIRVDAVLASMYNPENKVRVEVVDRLGRPVEDAVVALSDRDLGTTGTGGDLTIQGLESGDQSFTVRSQRYGIGTKVDVIVNEAGEQTVQAVVDWRPGSVQVTATDPKGLPVDATVSFVGASALPSRDVGTDGEELFILRPGQWDVEVSAPGMGTQIRTIEVSEDPGDLIAIDVGMRRDEGGDSELKLRVADVDGKALSDVEVKIDGQRIGRTGEDGVVVLQGLDAGSRELEFTGPNLATVKQQIELVGGGTQVAHATMGYVEGVTDLYVTGPGGRVVDAKVEVAGPQPVAPLQVGTDGYERLVLPEGSWKVTLSAPGMAPQSRTVVVKDGNQRRNELRVELAPASAAAAGSGQVAVRVVDPSGNAVDGARVQLNGRDAGGATGGELVADGLKSGNVQVAVAAEGMRPANVEVAVASGGSEVVEVPMEWAPGAMQVQVTGPGGAPIDAQVTLRGPAGAPAILPRSAVGGETVIGATPGQWQVVVEAPGMKTQVIPVSLPEAAQLTTVPVKMAPRSEDGAVVLLTAETAEGEVLANASVKVDGVEVGRTTAAGTFEIVELPSTDAVVTISADTGGVYDDVEIPLDVSRRQQRTDAELKTNVVLPYAAQDIAVVVEDASGQRVHAEVVAIQGKGESDAVNLMDGSGALSLRPGTYTVTARTEDGALATTDLVVEKPTAGAPPKAYIPNGDRDGIAAVEIENGMPVVSLIVETVNAAVSDGQLIPVNPILFDTAMDVLRADAMPLVKDLARWLLAHQEAALVEVGGHTDDVGGVVYNQQLSERRANTVMQALIGYGVAPERLRARGYGLSRPVTANVDAVERQRNRRVELVVLDWASD